MQFIKRVHRQGNAINRTIEELKLLEREGVAKLYNTINRTIEELKLNYVKRYTDAATPLIAP